MAYYINVQKNRKWRLIHQFYEGGERHQRALSEAEMATLGFTRLMSADEARDWAKKLGATEAIERRRHKILSLKAHNLTLNKSLLPPALITSFEQDELFLRFANSDKKRLASSKSMSHWRAAQILIHEIAVEPLSLFQTPQLVYNYCETKTWSLSYTKKLIRVLNLWTRFVARKTKTYHESIDYPTGRDARRIGIAYHKAHGRGKVSDPLTPSNLEQARSNFSEAQYRWLFIAVWFGLRPAEIDALRDKSTWRIERQRGVEVLFVFQAKITSGNPDDAWKLIPALYPEQQLALTYIRDGGSLKRPLPKTCKKYLGGQIMAYGGRKAFEDLMDQRGHTLEHISSWLGHRDSRTTITYYRKRLKVAI